MKLGAWFVSAAAAAVFDRAPERLIAFSRVLLAGFGLLAIQLDPTQPAHYVDVTRAVLGGYLAYAALVAAVSLVQLPGLRLQLAMHVVDVATFAVLLYLTEGPNSPFFVFFTFALFAATLRWQWQGALATALALVLLFGLVTWLEPGNSVSRAIIRGTYLFIAGAFLTGLGIIRERARLRLAQLAAWPVEASGEGESPPLQGTVAHALRVTDARGALVVWETLGEPFLHSFRLENGRLECHAHRELRVPPDPEDADIAGRAVVLLDPAAGLVRVGRGRTARRAMVPQAVLLGLDVHNAVLAPMRGQGCRGLVLLLGADPRGEDLLPLAEIAAARIGAVIEDHILNQQLIETAVLRERARLARDIHDGLLQALAAMILQLEAMAREAPPDVRPRLVEYRQMLIENQRRLREYVRLSRSRPPPLSEFQVESELGALLAGAAVQWGCEARLEVQPRALRLPRSLGVELSLLINEALSNAVRHGGARLVRAIVKQSGRCLSVVVTDDGRGFDSAGGPLPGAAESRHRPRSLSERVGELRGTVQFLSSSQGTRVEIEVPLQPGKGGASD